jgi:cysteine sulfinate desulfinase/cysteine desulfurase-like protein
MPWEGLVEICKEEKVWSIVDAAHCIGQIEVDLSKSQPDFWVSVSLTLVLQSLISLTIKHCAPNVELSQVAVQQTSDSGVVCTG